MPFPESFFHGFMELLRHARGLTSEAVPSVCLPAHLSLFRVSFGVSFLPSRSWLTTFFPSLLQVRFLSVFTRHDSHGFQLSRTSLCILMSPMAVSFIPHCRILKRDTSSFTLQSYLTEHPADFRGLGAGPTTNNCSAKSSFSFGLWHKTNEYLAENSWLPQSVFGQSSVK